MTYTSDVLNQFFSGVLRVEPRSKGELWCLFLHFLTQHLTTQRQKQQQQTHCTAVSREQHALQLLSEHFDDISAASTRVICISLNQSFTLAILPVASLGGGGGRTAPGDTLQGGYTQRKNFSWANLQRIVEKRGRKVWGDTLKGVTPE